MPLQEALVEDRVTSQQGGPPQQINTTVPHPARMYDCWLGGKDNYEVDREAAGEVARIAPEVVASARGNRDWMLRAARFLAQEAGVCQFLDIGTGIPTSPNLHEVVQEVVPACRVVYVDYDPIVLAHARALMISSSQGATDYMQADVRAPQQILTAPQVREMFDWSQPVALMLAALMHFVDDDGDPYKIVAMFRDALPVGSFMALSHATGDLEPQRAADAAAVYADKRAVSRVTVRSKAQVERFFTGFELVDPGVVPLPQWRPDQPMSHRYGQQVWLYGGVGRKTTA